VVAAREICALLLSTTVIVGLVMSPGIVAAISDARRNIIKRRKERDFLSCTEYVRESFRWNRFRVIL
jgi:hypothetical protein